MPTLLFRVNASDEFFDGADAAVLELDAPLATRLLKLRDVFTSAKAAATAAHDRCLDEMRFWDRRLRWFACTKLDTEPPEDEWKPLDEQASQIFKDDNAERTECDRLVVGEDGVHWTALDKYADVNFTTARVGWADIEAIARTG